jgi:putative transposase
MDFRRYYIPGSIIFITQVVQDRLPIFANDEYIELLRANLRAAQTLYPFGMLAYVFLPDHFHILIRPTDGGNFSAIMHSLKPNFTKIYKRIAGIKGNLKFWQKRFWDHVIRDEADFENRVHYIHCNPVKHGLATKPEDWPHSSFLAWKEKGAYPENWGWSPPEIAGDEWGE